MQWIKTWNVCWKKYLFNIRPPISPWMNSSSTIYPKCGKKDPEQALVQLKTALGDIDRHYAAIKAAKSQGKDRRSYLRKICDGVFRNVDRQASGTALTAIISELRAEKSPDSCPPYEGLDAVNYIHELDNALAQTALAIHNNTEEK